VGATEGSPLSELRYKAWGETRYTAGSMLTKSQFTGQRNETGSFGLYFYNARWYDNYLNRWIQPDTIIPDPYNPFDWDRYSYVRNNPVKYRDLSGHMANEGGDGGCDSVCMDRSRQNYLFSLVFEGSGKNGNWSAEDWKYYYSHRDELWQRPSSWKNPDSEMGLDVFALHVERLATHYSSTEKGQFVEDFALLFGGLSKYKSWPEAAFDARHGPTLPFLNEGNEGLRPGYIDSLNPTDNQSHHYAGIFFLSFHAEIEVATAINYGRDPDNPGDIALGNRAAQDAYIFRYYLESPSDMVRIILGLGRPR
jgi:RHS repeat-associated protein